MNFPFLILLALPFLYAEQEERIDFSHYLNITNHTIELENGELNYTATTGMCPIYTNETKEADLFFISYTKESEEERPITFVFPGGPGCAGTIEALLSFGPRRLLTTAEGHSPSPPHKIIDNPQTILEYTDLVFVDPVNCGFSKATEEGNLPHFFSVEGDIQTLAEFVHTYIDMGQRWNSPIYLAGGSYGTLRACGLSSHLLKYGMAVKGVILNGCAIAFSTLESERDQTLPDCLLIPTLAATAWYHGRLWPEKSLEEVVDYARCFAYNSFAPVMLQPSRLSLVEKAHFETSLAQLIGLPLETVKRYSSRINEAIFSSEFFRSERKILGRLDSRQSGDISTIDPFDSHDPSYINAIGTTAGFNSYLQKELNTRFPFSKYITFSPKTLLRWNFNSYDSKGSPDFLQRLRNTLIYNPEMKIFVASGYYDCRTPFAATEYCFEHLDLPSFYKKNIQFEYYEAGHGIVFDYPSLKKWKKDLTQFYGY